MSKVGIFLEAFVRRNRTKFRGDAQSLPQIVKAVMANDKMTWLQDFMLSIADGDWEHGDGITIKSLDNPGWEIAVDLEGTELDERPFQNISVRRTDHDWMDCRKEGAQFRGFCGPKNLDEMIEVFRAWVEMRHLGP